jgi:nucleotide-binding universal stress UspA family protein
MVTGWRRLRLGHIANAVAAKAHQPVLVVKQPPQVAQDAPLGRRILVATGGSPWSDRAVEHAITLAQSEHLSMCLLHVLPGRARRRQSEADAEGQQILDRAASWATDAGIATDRILAHGDVPRTIVATAAEQQCDGIVLGSRGSSGWKRLMLGSISNAVIVTTVLPVLVVKRFLGD